MKSKTATTVEARERQLISLAVDQAEKMLAEGKAPPAVLMHYLRLGATDYPLRKERLQRQNELFKAKKESLEKQDQMEEIVNNAMKAMQRYSGVDQEEYYEAML